MISEQDRPEPMKTAATEVVSRKTTLLLGLMVGVALAAFGFNHLMGKDGKPEIETIAAGIDEKVFSTLTRSASPERAWTQRSENRFAGLEERLKELENQNASIKESLDRANKNKADALKVIEAQADEIERLEAMGGGYGPEIGPVRDDPLPLGDPFQTVALEPLPREVPQAFAAAAPAVPVPAAQPLRVTFNLDEREGLAAKSTDIYLPAGSYAPAVVISGADASVGLRSQSDPLPVLLRITGPALTAAADGMVQEIDIEGCTITAEARGDLSSEKVYVRTQTMTCARRAGETTETEIHASVAGSGKAGVRGRVISRDGDLIDRALWAGAFEGLGQGASQVFRPRDLALAGGQVVGQTNIMDRIQDVGLSAMGSGLSNAASTVSQYLIDRAEQYQPVISLQAGTRVELVFIKGAFLDGKTRSASVSAQSGPASK